MKQALERDYAFITEDLTDGRAPITNKMIELMLVENQKKLLVNLIAANEDKIRPRFLSLEQKKYQGNIKKIMGGGTTFLLNSDD
jgi:hypothetical protein